MVSTSEPDPTQPNSTKGILTMNARAKRVASGSIAGLAVAGVVTVAAIFGTSAQSAAPVPTPMVTATVEVDPASFPVYTSGDRIVDQAASDALEAQRAAEAEAARVEAERVAAEQAAAEQAAAEQAERDSQNQTRDSSGGGQQSAPAPAQPAPVRCPAGSQALSGDGGNDTSCLPEICFRITLPDAAHPECATPFRP